MLATLGRSAAQASAPERGDWFRLRLESAPMELRRPRPPRIAASERLLLRDLEILRSGERAFPGLPLLLTPMLSPPSVALSPATDGSAWEGSARALVGPHVDGIDRTDLGGTVGVAVSGSF